MDRRRNGRQAGLLLRGLQMKSVVVSGVLFIVLMVSPIAHAATANEWRGWTEIVQGAYVAGILDGLNTTANIIVRLAGPDVEPVGTSTLLQINRCAVDRKMTFGQMIEIVNKFVRERPNR
jgi:hypothetical protein